MSLGGDRVEALGQELWRALVDRRVVEPLTGRVPGLTIDDAYAIQRVMVAQRLEERGETIVGKKIGVTSEAVQTALGVDQPDFGQLTSGMQFDDGATLPLERFIQPRAEGEIAIFLRDDLTGGDVGPADVLAAAESAAACFEIVDSRIRDWKIAIEDTVADDASSAAFVIGPERVDPRSVDWEGCRMRLERGGELAGEGVGSATLGSALKATAWLANTLARLGLPLRAGEVVLSGSLGPLLPVGDGDELRVTIDGIGSAHVAFAGRVGGTSS